MIYQELPKNEKEYNGAIYSLKGISPLLDTADGVSFSATLYKDNEPFADVYDDGWGGPLSYNFHTDETLSFEEQEDVACEVVYYLLDVNEKINYIKRWQANNIIFANDTTIHCFPIKNFTMFELHCYPQGREYLKKVIQKYVNDGYQCLNTNIDITLIPFV